MRSLIQKLNWIHLVMLASLPVVLALINPNWIFNVGIIDDYIYLGYQLDFPKYIGWLPSSDHYFIERISWVLPAYIIRQIFSPLIANFVVHLGVYYLAIFSVYGTLNRLFNARVALLTGLLMGQFSLFLRAVGWDYVDGYTLALFALCVLLLTYAVQSSHYRWYLAGAGGVAMLMINTQVFAVSYLPALAVYYLHLNHHVARRHIIQPIVWGGLGTAITFGLLTLVYYALTGKWFIFENTMNVAQGIISPQGWRDFINTHPASNYMFGAFFLAIGVITLAIRILAIIKHRPVIRPMEVHQQALIALFTGALGVFAFWTLLNYHGYFRLTFYVSQLLPSTFLLIGALIIIKIDRASYALWVSIYGAILFLFAIFPHVPFDTTIAIALIIGVGVLWGATFILKPHYALFCFTISICLISYVAGKNIHTISIFLSDRYQLQAMYETTIEARQYINQRYERYDLENFRFWLSPAYSLDETRQVMGAITSLYLSGWGRQLTLFDPQLLIFDEAIESTRNIILMTSPAQSEVALEQVNQFLADYNVTLEVVEHVMLMDTLSMAITQILSYYTLEEGIFRHEFDIPVRGELGFGDLEVADNRTYRWTNEPTARITYRLEPDAFDPAMTYQVQLLVMAYLEEAVRDSVSLTINGERLALIRTPQGADSLFTAQIDGAILAGDVLELVFETDGISRPADFGYPDPRTLGVAFDWLIIHPLSTDE